MKAPAHPGLCYTSAADKRAKFPELVAAITNTFKDAIDRKELAETVVIYANWLAGNDLRPVLQPRNRFGDEETARKLWELMAGIPYVYTGWDGCDPIKTPADILKGADCDQAVLAIAVAAWLMGYPRVDMVAAGDQTDPYQHAFAIVYGTDSYWILDANGDGTNRGAFNATDDAPKHTAWTLYRHDDRPQGRI